MMNYYWKEGHLSGDQGRRILVLHNGQVSQCSHCLRRAGQGCPAGGNGKACRQMDVPRAKMHLYMQGLRAQTGYVSLKTLYLENQAKNFPSLMGFEEEIPNNIEEPEDGIESENLIEEKDRMIADLQKRVDELEPQQSEVNLLREALAQTKVDLNTSLKKIAFTQKATEQRLLESIENTDGFFADPVLIGVYSATLEEDKIDLETSENERMSRKETFLKSMEEKLDPKNQEHNERFQVIKNQILEKVKATQISRSRSRSWSKGSMKRELSTESLSSVSGNSPVRARTSGIPKKT